MTVSLLNDNAVFSTYILRTLHITYVNCAVDNVIPSR